MLTPTVSPLPRGWHRSLGSLVSGVEDRLTIAAPFVTQAGTQEVATHLPPDFRDRGTLNLITDLSPTHVSDGSLEPAAIEGLMSSVANSRLWHVPRLHAKVYLADATRAIVTSGNLTAGALFRNVEYGLDVSDPRLIAKIEADMAEIRFLGVPVQPDGLREYARVATKVRETNQARESDVDPALRQTFLNAMRTAEDELVRLRLAGGAMHTVFAKTVVYLLGKHGPLPTPDLHALVQEAHPDLCDDGVDRVIDGKSYGKKWKHAVRTAQQQAKRSGLVGHDEGLWFAT